MSKCLAQPRSNRRDGHVLLRNLRRPACLIACLLAVLIIDADCHAQADIEALPLLQLDMLDTPTDDLLRLAEAYPDALRDLKAAQLSIETVTRLRPSAVVTNLEVQIAKLNLEAAERKAAIIRMICEKQLRAAENKLAIVTYLENLGNPIGKQGDGEDRNYVRVNDEATVRILKTILAMQ